MPFVPIDPGKFYSSRESGRAELPATEEPDVWICRRVADYKVGQIPETAHFARCAMCFFTVAYNPATKFTCPKVCMQCEGIEPLEIP